jgi:uncharacterized membrane protein YsdA (DUF1294 family)/cold shock CspA family protein
MRYSGTLTSWNDERGFGHIEPRKGGEPVFLHISAWPRGTGRPQIGQVVTFEVELGARGSRARDVRLFQAQRPRKPARRWVARKGAGTLLALPIFLVVYLVIAATWKLPLWVAGLYLGLSAFTFLAYASDKAAASSGSWRTPEKTLHLLALAGGWPGALLAQYFLRHKSTKPAFRVVFWATVLLNVVGLVVLASEARQSLLRTLRSLI